MLDCTQRFSESEAKYYFELPPRTVRAADQYVCFCTKNINCEGSDQHYT